MKIHCFKIQYLFFAFALFTAFSCGNSKEKELDRLVVSLASEDKEIDSKDWQEIVSLINSDKRAFKDFCNSNGDVDEAKLKSYIVDLMNGRRPSVDVSFVGVGKEQNVKVNFYLERSGSMIPYDDVNGNGNFKAAIVQLLNNLPGDVNNNKIYVVNSTINEYPEGFSKFLTDTNIFEATKNIGDPSYTNFSEIFKTLLNNTKSNELSILVSDMIYSTKEMSVVNPEKIFNEIKGMTHAVFNNIVKTKSMLILKMQGSYNGPYYTYNSPNKGIAYQGERPYYIVIVGDNALLARISKDKNYSSFRDFANLPGFQEQYLFETSGIYRPYYSFLLSNSLIKGRFRPEHNQANSITNIEDLEADKESGELDLVLAVDLNNMFINKNYLVNPRNYEVIADDEIQIKAIKPITDSDRLPAEKKYLSTATHLFVLSAKEISHEQEVKIRLINNFPQWVYASSTDDDTQPNSTTTFALKYLLQGIYDSYKKNSAGVPYYFELNMNLKK